MELNCNLNIKLASFFQGLPLCNTCEMFVACLTRRFVSAKRIFTTDLQNRGPDCKHREFANGTLSIMLNRLPINSEGLLRVSWPRRNAPSEKPRTFHKYLTIFQFFIA